MPQTIRFSAEDIDKKPITFSSSDIDQVDNTSSPPTDMRTASEVAADQAMHVVKGIPQAVTGIPAAASGIGSALWDALTGKGTAKAQALVQGAATPITTSLRGAGALIAPSSVTAPTREEFENAAEGAGANAGGLLMGELAAKGIPFAARTLKPLTASPGLDAATVNRWMDVAPSEVNHGANPGQRLLDQKLLGPTKEATKANVDAALAKTGQQMNVQLAAADQSGVTFNVKKIVDKALDDAKAKLKAPTDEAFARHVESNRQKLSAQDLTKLTPSQVHELKTYVGDSIAWKGARLDDPLNEAYMEIYRGLNDKIKTNVGGMTDLQSEWADLRSASRNLRDSLNENKVGRGSADVPETPSSFAVQLAKKGAKFALPTSGLLGTGYGLYKALTRP